MNWIMDIAWIQLLSISSNFSCTDFPVSSLICSARMFLWRGVLANLYFWYSFAFICISHTFLLCPFYMTSTHVPQNLQCHKGNVFETHTSALWKHNIVYVCETHSNTPLTYYPTSQAYEGLLHLYFKQLNRYVFGMGKKIYLIF